MPDNMAIAAVSIPTQNKTANLNNQLKQIHKRIQRQYPFVSCIEVAFNSTFDKPSLVIHAASCQTSLVSFLKPGIQRDTSSGEARTGSEVIEDLSVFSGDEEAIEKVAAVTGFQSGLSIPLIVNKQRHGFTFFTARKKNYFTPDVIRRLHVYTQVISQIVSEESNNTHRLDSAIASILQLNNINKSESPSHLQRVAHYSRLIAENCSHRHSLPDEWIEHLFLFAPLHDIGKIFISDDILSKPARLTDQEFQHIKTHTLKGRNIIDHMISSFGYREDTHHTNMLRNIVTLHHEAIDGSGYPYGLKGNEIPLEARIVAVADVLDALMSKRVYKHAWSIEETLAKLQQMAGSRLEAEFVEILEQNQSKLLDIQACFPQ
jgi:HD-GYP domain-containing protein (c-di-GMP phosphodiesterase class II)